MADSQNTAILAHLRAGRSITSLEAIGLFGCTRLAARVLDLRRAGHPITGKAITTDTGKRCKQYHMEKTQ